MPERLPPALGAALTVHGCVGAAQRLGATVAQALDRAEVVVPSDALAAALSQAVHEAQQAQKALTQAQRALVQALETAP